MYTANFPLGCACQCGSSHSAAGLYLSGGPTSVYEPGAPTLPDYVLASQQPVLGICYGMQLLTHYQGGQVAAAQHREYGLAQIECTTPNTLIPTRCAAGVDVTRRPD
jgi:GMP synthase-like glutamine amidotransferase